MKACVFLLSAGGLLLAGSGLAQWPECGPTARGSPGGAAPCRGHASSRGAGPCRGHAARGAAGGRDDRAARSASGVRRPGRPGPHPASADLHGASTGRAAAPAGTAPGAGRRVPVAPPPPCPACPAVPTVYAAPAERAGRHTHDGFFMRLSAGGGYLGARDEQGTANATFHGGAGSFALALGGAVSDNLIIYGEGLGQQVDTGELKLAYDRRRDGSFDVKGSMGLYGGGPGLAYYFMPYNTYISGTLLFTRLVWSEDDLGEEDSEAGQRIFRAGRRAVALGRQGVVGFLQLGPRRGGAAQLLIQRARVEPAARPLRGHHAVVW